MSIAALLKEFSQESEEQVNEEIVEEGQVGAEEITVVTDETTTELEEAIEEVAEAVEEQEEVAETTEVLLDAAESLENAIAQIEELRLSGQRVNGVSMKIWARGVADSLEARQIPAEVYQDLMDDFGASFESTDTYSDYSAEAEEKGEGIMAKIWNMIKSAFARARDFLARLIGWFGKSAEAIIKAGRKLQEAVKDKKELKTAGSKVNSKPYIELANASGDVNADNALTRAGETFDKADTAATAVYDAAVTAAGALKGGQDADVKKFDGALNAFDSLNGEIIGNTTVQVTGKQGSSWYNEGKVTMKIKYEKRANVNVRDQSDPMTISQLTDLGKKLVSFGENIKKKMDDAKRTQGKLNVDFPKGDDGKHVVEKMKERRVIARSIQSSSALAGNVRGKVSSVALAVAKKAYVYGMANARMYK